MNLNAQMCSRSTLVCPNAFALCSNELLLDACRSKCLSDMLRRALALRLSSRMHFWSVEMRSCSMPVDPNAFRIRVDALSHDACQSKCFSDTLKCALARRLLTHAGVVLQHCFFKQRWMKKEHVCKQNGGHGSRNPLDAKEDVGEV